MPEVVNTTPLELRKRPNAIEAGDKRETMVKVDNVSMIFNMANEQLNSLKEYVIALAKRELMFKEFRALDDVSFEVKRGDVFGILGTNGSGKSTMLKIIAGVLEPTKGTCQVNGQIAPLIELGAGFDMDLTARENIYLNGALLGYSHKFIDKHFDEIVEFAEIEKFLDMPMKNYSSGMVARIAFAIATVIVPEVLICDEVLSVGDFMFQQKCERRIMSLIKEHDVTVLIVSHSNSQIERLCNKAIWIEKGHTRMVGNAKDVCDTYRLLGGHTGSPEAEQRVFEMLQRSVRVPSKTIDAITSETRYSTASKLAERCEFETGGTAIIAPGECAYACMAAQGLSGVLDAPVLLTKPEGVPDATSQELSALKPSKLIVIGSESLVSAEIADELADSYPKAQITRVEGTSPAQLSCTIFDYVGNLGKKWGNCGIITYEQCIGDLVSFLPYTFQRSAATLFVESWGNVGEEVKKRVTSGAFNKLLVLGGNDHIPDADLANWEAAGIACERVCGNGPYHANELINNRMSSGIDENDGISIERLIVTSVHNPWDAFAAGAYAGKTNSAFLLEDPQDLDSVAHALAYIQGKNGQIKRLTFLGDAMRYSPLDKRLLAKALVLAQRMKK